MQVAEIAYKYIDIISAVAKFYCYQPSEANKMDMKRGIGDENATYERPECCPHYDSAKRSFDGAITFCSECEDPRCAINRYECQRFAATAEFIIAIQKLPRHKVANFNFHDFFKPDEIDRFLQFYTVSCRPWTKQNSKVRFKE